MENQVEQENTELPFVREQHANLLLNLDKTLDSDAIGQYTNEHLKLPGGYWCLGALYLLNKVPQSRQQEISQFIKACQHECGGFGGNIGHDPGLVNTLYALLILAMYDSLESVDLEKMATYIASLQNEDGSFKGDYAGEVDTRFSYSALSALKLLGKLDLIDRKKARDFVLRCHNIDGAFGGVPGAESHAAYTFCSIGALKILDDEDLIDRDKLGAWLSKRQTLQGGFNGRPEKLPDVCYSWWILSTCFMIERQQWIDFAGLKDYVLNCQDPENGGIGDRPGNEVDVFHTFFGLTALSLMGFYDLEKIDHVYAIPVKVIQKHFPHIYN
ncbi:geranylgeranyl transferase type-2 subunit beta-like [Stylonychia lemnae]|uniref:Geranylgeranyl transferase type-2 subunit beta n=1 Tax=Stylonychia lemnae TaxID=5949 RepID=A0A078BAK7_STYLE|nr:geranylgeranyl transferase type-2 subunit beta-like [Stylonychia lemnae]|eukprot:CDW90292.1 geranylgeranyl transferase type-2 subunit beta-like [Stylonychia lemnae]